MKKFKALALSATVALATPIAIGALAPRALATPPWQGASGATTGGASEAGVIGIYAPTSQSFTYSNGAGVEQLTYSGSAGQSASGNVGINNTAGVSTSASAAASMDASASATLNLAECGECGNNTLNNVLGYGAGGFGSDMAYDAGIVTVSGTSNSNIENTTTQSATEQKVTTVSTSDSAITGVGADSAMSAASTSSFTANVERNANTQDAPIATANASANMTLGSTANATANSSSFNSVFIQEFGN